MFAEVWQVDRHLYERDAAGLGADVRSRLEEGRAVSSAAYEAGLAHRAVWRAELAAAFARTPVLAWPTLAMFPTRIDAPAPNTRRTNIPVNLAGHPSLALPAPSGGPIPASLQLVGPDHSEDILCTTGLRLQQVAATLA